jgi:hypothetical protein
MSNRIAGYEPDLNNNKNVRSFSTGGALAIGSAEKNTVPEIMASEGREDFYRYFKDQGFSKVRNLVFLSSVRHYYYDAEEMKNVKIVINLKELNQIKDVKSFLHSIHNILPHKSIFMGCFVDNNKVNGYEIRNNLSPYQTKLNNDEIENGVVSHNPFLNMLYNFIDFKTNKHMSRASVSLLLEDHGFKVLDMKEINGLTYFHSQKVNSADN